MLFSKLTQNTGGTAIQQDTGFGKLAISRSQMTSTCSVLTVRSL